MAIESSRGFVLWAVPRFRRSYQPANSEIARAVPVTVHHSVQALWNLPISAIKPAADLEDPEAAACSRGCHSAYH